MDLAIASAFTLAYANSQHSPVQLAQLQKGEKVLVLGASGGVGLAAAEIAKALGAHVIAAASSAEKLELAARHGADELVNYATQDLKVVMKSLTGESVDVVYDPVGDRLADPVFAPSPGVGAISSSALPAGRSPPFRLTCLC